MWLEILLLLLTILLTVIVAEQVSYYRTRAWLPGPKSVPPFIGQIVDMVSRPFDFYQEQRQYGNMSWTAIMGR